MQSGTEAAEVILAVAKAQEYAEKAALTTIDNERKH
jgi:hypothetical protein